MSKPTRKFEFVFRAGLDRTRLARLHVEILRKVQAGAWDTLVRESLPVDSAELEYEFNEPGEYRAVFQGRWLQADGTHLPGVIVKEFLVSEAEFRDDPIFADVLIVEGRP